MPIAVRLVIGIGLTAGSAYALREGWWPAAAYLCMALGLGTLLVAGWRWLERDLERRVRWSEEHRVRALSRVAVPDAQPVAGSAEGRAPPLPDRDGEAAPARVEEVAVRPGP